MLELIHFAVIQFKHLQNGGVAARVLLYHRSNDQRTIIRSPGSVFDLLFYAVTCQLSWPFARSPHTQGKLFKNCRCCTGDQNQNDKWKRYNAVWSIGREQWWGSVGEKDSVSWFWHFSCQSNSRRMIDRWPCRGLGHLNRAQVCFATETEWPKSNGKSWLS